MSTTMTEEKKSAEPTTGRRQFTLMIFSCENYYSDRAKVLAFPTEEEARHWAHKYLEAYTRHSVFLVDGTAEALSPPVKES